MRTARKPCRVCGLSGHSTFNCFARKRPTQLRRTNRGLKPIGRVTKKWMLTRAAWFHTNEPDKNGFYTCYYCGERLLPNEVELDHMYSRSRHPELRSELTNLVPACHTCNSTKGSKDADEFIALIESGTITKKGGYWIENENRTGKVL